MQNKRVILEKITRTVNINTANMNKFVRIFPMILNTKSNIIHDSQSYRRFVDPATFLIINA